MNFIRKILNENNPFRRVYDYWKSLKKEYKSYYLVVLSVLILTLANQSIMQYALAEQRDAALIVNLAGRQRTLSQRILNEIYACKYHDCDFSDLKLSWTSLLSTHQALQRGNDRLGLPPLDNKKIQADFDRLKPVIDRLALQLDDLNNPEQVDFDALRADTDQFLVLMDGIVTSFQLKSERDIRSIRLIELQLAVFSVLIVLFEIFFIVIPILQRNERQSQKLQQLAWHQSHAFASHMKNIKDLEFVLKVEKKGERRDEIYRFIQEELHALQGVSDHMQKALDTKDDTLPDTRTRLWSKVEFLLEKAGLITREMPSHVELIHDDKALSE